MGACLATVLVLGAGCSPESSDADDWGFVMIQFLRAAGQDGSPFVGTVRIRAAVSYDDCLAEFYQASPDWREDGLEGSAMFEEASDKACQAQCGYEPIPCDHVNIWQSGIDEESLNLEYHVTVGKDDEIENRVLNVGPIPTAERADCDDGALPTVSLSAVDITGQGSEGGTIWLVTSALGGDKATVSQCEPMKVRVARAG
jgi:hypothetical protein